jgi:hypothetical protein
MELKEKTDSTEFFKVKKDQYDVLEQLKKMELELRRLATRLYVTEQQYKIEREENTKLLRALEALRQQTKVNL